MTSARRSPLVFVVDDDAITTCMISKVLQSAGFRVSSALDGAKAMACIAETVPDLILLDVNLPDACGLDICRRLKSQPGASETPVLFISSNHDTASKVKGFEAGAVDYIPKPIVGEEVIARVRSHLRLKQAYEELAKLHAERVERLAGAQESLLITPESLPEAKFSVALRQVVKAGGDFYDVVIAGDQLTDYIVADASGHDWGSSIWTAALKTLIGQYATATDSPLTIVQSINNALRRIVPEGIYFTLSYARLNRSTGRLHLVNAGHPPALVLRQAENQTLLIGADGDVVGAFADALFGTLDVTVRAGDRVFLLSDGLIELHGSREQGLRQLESVCLRHRDQALTAAVEGTVEVLTANTEVTDDILLMGIEV